MQKGKFETYIDNVTLWDSDKYYVDNISTSSTVGFKKPLVD